MTKTEGKDTGGLVPYDQWKCVSGRSDFGWRSWRITNNQVEVSYFLKSHNRKLVGKK